MRMQDENLIHYLQSALTECKSILPSEDVDEVVRYIYHNECGIALQSLSYYFVDKNIKFPEVASEYIRKAAVAMEMDKEEDDEHWLWEKIEPLLTE
jgi:hypothetical protein